jgi:hypothetical protein
VVAIVLLCNSALKNKISPLVRVDLSQRREPRFVSGKSRDGKVAGCSYFFWSTLYLLNAYACSRDSRRTDCFTWQLLLWTSRCMWQIAFLEIKVFDPKERNTRYSSDVHGSRAV